MSLYEMFAHEKKAGTLPRSNTMFNRYTLLIIMATDIVGSTVLQTNIPLGSDHTNV